MFACMHTLLAYRANSEGFMRGALPVAPPPTYLPVVLSLEHGVDCLSDEPSLDGFVVGRGDSAQDEQAAGVEGGFDQILQDEFAARVSALSAECACDPDALRDVEYAVWEDRGALYADAADRQV